MTEIQEEVIVIIEKPRKRNKRNIKKRKKQKSKKFSDLHSLYSYIDGRSTSTVDKPKNEEKYEKKKKKSQKAIKRKKIQKGFQNMKKTRKNKKNTKKQKNTKKNLFILRTKERNVYFEPRKYGKHEKAKKRRRKKDFKFLPITNEYDDLLTSLYSSISSKSYKKPKKLQKVREKLINFHVKSNKTRVYRISKNKTTEELKSMISSRRNIHPKYFYLTCEGKNLRDDVTISTVCEKSGKDDGDGEYHVDVDLSVKVRGGVRTKKKPERRRVKDLFNLEIQKKSKGVEYVQSVKHKIEYKFNYFSFKDRDSNLTVKVFDLSSFKNNLHSEIKDTSSFRNSSISKKFSNFIRKFKNDVCTRDFSDLYVGKSEFGGGNKKYFLGRKNVAQALATEIENMEGVQVLLIPHRNIGSKKVGKKLDQITIKSSESLKNDSSLKRKYKKRLKKIHAWFGKKFPKILKMHNINIPIMMELREPYFNEKFLVSSDGVCYTAKEYAENFLDFGNDMDKKKQSLKYYHLKLLLKITDSDFKNLSETQGWPTMRTIRNHLKDYINGVAEMLSILFYKENQCGVCADLSMILKGFIERNPVQVVNLILHTKKVLEEKRSSFGLAANSEINFPLFKERRVFKVIGNEIIVTVQPGVSHDGAERLRTRKKFSGSRDKRMFELGVISFVDSCVESRKKDWKWYYDTKNYLPFFLCFLDMDKEKIEEVFGTGLNKMLNKVENSVFCFDLPKELARRLVDDVSVLEGKKFMKVKLKFKFNFCYDQKAGLFYIKDDDTLSYRANISRGMKWKFFLEKSLDQSIEEGININNIKKFEDLYLVTKNLEKLRLNKNEKFLKIPEFVHSISESLTVLENGFCGMNDMEDDNIHGFQSMHRSILSFLETFFQLLVDLNATTDDFWKTYYTFLTTSPFNIYSKSQVFDLKEDGDGNLEDLKVKRFSGRNNQEAMKYKKLYRADLIENLFSTMKGKVKEELDSNLKSEVKKVLETGEKVMKNLFEKLQVLCELMMKSGSKLLMDSEISEASKCLDYLYIFYCHSIQLTEEYSNYSICWLVCASYDLFFKRSLGLNSCSTRELFNRIVRKIFDGNSTHFRKKVGLRKIDLFSFNDYYSNEGMVDDEEEEEEKIRINEIPNSTIQVLFSMFASTADFMFKEKEMNVVVDEGEGMGQGGPVVFQKRENESELLERDKNPTANVGELKYYELKKFYGLCHDLASSLYALSQSVSKICISNILSPKYSDHLKPHQKKDLRMVVDEYNDEDEDFVGMVKGWDTGVGKSIGEVQHTSAISNTRVSKFSNNEISKYNFSFIFCPAQLKVTWNKKFLKWNHKYKTKQRLVLYTNFGSFKKNIERKRTGSIVVMSFSQLKKIVGVGNSPGRKSKNRNIGDDEERRLFFKKIFKITRYCVFDEFHILMNNEIGTKTMEKLKGLIMMEEKSKKVVFRALTATPMRNENTLKRIYESMSSSVKKTATFIKNYDKCWNLICSCMESVIGESDFKESVSVLQNLLEDMVSYEYLKLERNVNGTENEKESVNLYSEIVMLPFNDSEHEEHIGEAEFGVGNKNIKFWNCIHPEARDFFYEMEKKKEKKEDDVVIMKRLTNGEKKKFSRIVQESKKLSFLRKQLLYCKSNETKESVVVAAESVDILRFVRLCIPCAGVNKETEEEEEEGEDESEDEKTREVTIEYDDFYQYWAKDSNDKEKELNLSSFDVPASFGILLLSTKSGAVGIDIVSCRYVVNLTTHWDHTWLSQVLGRCFRTGQNRDVIGFTLVVGKENQVFRSSIKKDFFGRLMIGGNDFYIRENFFHPYDNVLFQELKKEFANARFDSYGNRLKSLKNIYLKENDSEDSDSDSSSMGGGSMYGRKEEEEEDDDEEFLDEEEIFGLGSQSLDDESIDNNNNNDSHSYQKRLIYRNKKLLEENLIGESINHQLRNENRELESKIEKLGEEFLELFNQNKSSELRSSGVLTLLDHNTDYLMRMEERFKLIEIRLQDYGMSSDKIKEIMDGVLDDNGRKRKKNVEEAEMKSRFVIKKRRKRNFDG